LNIFEKTRFALESQRDWKITFHVGKELTLEGSCAGIEYETEYGRNGETEKNKYLKSKMPKCLNKPKKLN